MVPAARHRDTASGRFEAFPGRVRAPGPGHGVPVGGPRLMPDLGLALLGRRGLGSGRTDGAPRRGRRRGRGNPCRRGRDPSGVSGGDRLPARARYQGCDDHRRQPGRGRLGRAPPRHRRGGGAGPAGRQGRRGQLPGGGRRSPLSATASTMRPPSRRPMSDRHRGGHGRRCRVGGHRPGPKRPARCRRARSSFRGRPTARWSRTSSGRRATT